MGRYPTFTVNDYVDVLRHLYHWSPERIARHTGVEHPPTRSQTLTRYPNDRHVLRLVSTLDELGYFRERELSLSDHHYRHKLKLSPPTTVLRLIIAELHSSRNIADFLRCAVRRFNSLSEATRLWCEQTDTAVRICHQYFYDEENFGGPQRFFLFIIKGLREVFGIDAARIKVKFAASGIRDEAGFIARAGCGITSDGDYSMIEIGVDYAGYVNPAINPSALRAIGEALDDLMEPVEIDLLASVERILERHLAEHHRSLDIEATALLLGMSRATLHRRFAEQGQSFRTLRGKTRLAYAAQLLRSTPLSITQISASLGYSASSAFCRAFKAQHNRSPMDYRNIYLST